MFMKPIYGQLKSLFMGFKLRDGLKPRYMLSPLLTRKENCDILVDRLKRPLVPGRQVNSYPYVLEEPLSIPTPKFGSAVARSM